MSAPVEKLLINIWYHQMHRRVKSDQKCCCDYFIISCRLSAKRKWKRDYIDFDTAIKQFTSLNLKLVNVFRQLKNKDSSCKNIFKRSKK